MWLVRFDGVKLKCLERLSAIPLWLPGMCWANREELLEVMSSAKRLATVSCMGCSTGLKVEWWSHPRADELSVRLMIRMPLSESFVVRALTEISTVTVAAMNSRRLMETCCWRCGGICQRQAKPSEEKPPIPVSDASDRQKVEGRENETWSSLIPLCVAC